MTNTETVRQQVDRLISKGHHATTTGQRIDSDEGPHILAVDQDDPAAFSDSLNFLLVGIQTLEAMVKLLATKIDEMGNP